MLHESSFESQYHDLEITHANDMQQLTHWIEESYYISLNSILEDKLLIHALKNSASRLMYFPHLVLIHGFPLSTAKPELAEKWLSDYVHQPFTAFKDWFNENVSEDKNVDVKKEIIERTKRYFAQWWLHSEGGNSQSINWESVHKSFDKLAQGENSNLYPPFTMLFNGIQIAAIEEFAQSTAPIDMFGPHAETLQ